jgi:hypothetical protein
VSQQVLHVDFISLSPTAGPDDRRQLLEAASQLSAMPQVQSLGAIEADAASGPDFDIVIYYLLPDFSALEPFGTDSRYAGFLQGALAARLKAFAGADIRLESDFAAGGPYAACLALMAPEETYDWEVRAALQAWCDAAANTSSDVGLAIGEKQMYRGAAIAFSAGPISTERPDTTRFRTTLIAGTARDLT